MTISVIVQIATFIGTIIIGIISLLFRVAVFQRLDEVGAKIAKMDDSQQAFKDHVLKEFATNDTVQRTEAGIKELWIEHNALRERVKGSETEIVNLKERR